MDMREVIFTDSLSEPKIFCRSYEDFGCILNAIDTPPPTPKTNIIELPGADGVLDTSTALTDGEMRYENRTVTMKLYATGREWKHIINDVVNTLHGKKMFIHAPDDGDFWFCGRIFIATENNKSYGILTVTADCEPWKYRKDETEYVISVSSDEKNVKIRNDGTRTIVPRFYIASDETVTISSGPVKLTGLTGPAAYILTDIPIRSGVTSFTIKATGEVDVKISFREKVL